MSNSDLSPISLFLTVGCGFYFYGKVVRAMYWQPAPIDAAAKIPVSRLSLVTMWIMVGLIFVWAFFRKSRSVFASLGGNTYRRVGVSACTWIGIGIARATHFSARRLAQEADFRGATS